MSPPLLSPLDVDPSLVFLSATEKVIAVCRGHRIMLWRVRRRPDCHHGQGSTQLDSQTEMVALLSGGKAIHPSSHTHVSLFDPIRLIVRCEPPLASRSSFPLDAAPHRASPDSLPHGHAALPSPLCITGRHDHCTNCRRDERNGQGLRVSPRCRGMPAKGTGGGESLQMVSMGRGLRWACTRGRPIEARAGLCLRVRGSRRYRQRVWRVQVCRVSLLRAWCGPRTCMMCLPSPA